LKEISLMRVAPQDHTNRLSEGKKAADRGETIDVTDWAREQITKRFFTDRGQIEKLVRIVATEGVEAALESLDGTPEEDDEAHRAALRALGDDERGKE
jgi:hypothetical protein